MCRPASSTSSAPPTTTPAASARTPREPAPSSSTASRACQTDPIQFGPLDELRGWAGRRRDHLRKIGVGNARLYGDDADDGDGGAGAFFLLLDRPEVYGLPPDPVVTTRDLPRMWA